MLGVSWLGEGRSSHLTSRVGMFVWSVVCLRLYERFAALQDKIMNNAKVVPSEEQPSAVSPRRPTNSYKTSFTVL